MAKIIKLTKYRRAQDQGRDGQSLSRRKAKKLGKDGKTGKWSLFETRTLAAPFAVEMIRSRQIAPPMPEGRSATMESGVLAFRREGNGEPSILLITKKHSKNWGIPKGKVVPHLSFAENAAKEAFEEAGVIGYVSSSSVGMFRAKKRGANPLLVQIIEVWVYLLEVTEILSDWPEKEKRATRWVSCEAAARQLREPVLAHLCHRLAQT